MLDSSTVTNLLNFRAERDWEQFHAPRNLAISLSLEAAELLEVFQWAGDDGDSEKLAQTRRDDIVEELADIAIYLTYLAHDLEIDLDKAVKGKLELNRKRYPVENSKGRSTKYDR